MTRHRKPGLRLTHRGELALVVLFGAVLFGAMLIAGTVEAALRARGL